MFCIVAQALSLYIRLSSNGVFTTDAHPGLPKPLLKFNVNLANAGLTSLVKGAKG